MPSYLFVYHSPAATEDTAPPTPEEMEQVMSAWQAWAAGVGEGLRDFGAPLASGVRLTADGASPSTRDVSGYSLVDAPSLETAQEIARANPHLQMPGAEIEVHEAQAIPGR